MPSAVFRYAGLFRAVGIGITFIVGASLPASVVARTVEYLGDLVAIRTAADDQGIAGPFSEAPAPGDALLALETATAADHRVIIASNYCQAYHIENPVSLLLQDLVAAANGPSGEIVSPVGKPVVKVRVLSGSTLLRCMGKSDLATICKNRVRITADASVTRADGSVAHAPLVAQVEREGRVGGFCGNIARYTGIVTREAAIDLLRQARAL
ncbi:hypothetical protein [Novosphingobium sp. P6W]|uniref:hypothetical protein n=1 Tax=Novosphingobium sp. P6W TaxID=1609758 RepID=UPI0005C2DB1E|nr:hypothetical protein [Novosphingobium sp. P6W]AXB75883.1 hypothetical protein TQ38_004585 [Novosphingobium sp. P6W]KIS32917.1 hypothetical protein TQ38_05295 [Novosphingobium sp. P6W]